MNKAELQALTILTGAPHALYEGVVYVQVEGGTQDPEDTLCTGCFFTNRHGCAGSIECQNFRTPELALYGVSSHHRMCDNSESRFNRPIWVKAAYD